MEKFEDQKGEKLRLEKLADELDRLQAPKNDGRGVSCVQTIVIYLRLGKLAESRAICWNELDKIRNYPEIKAWLKKNLFSNVQDRDNPFWLEDRWEGKKREKSEKNKKS